MMRRIPAILLTLIIIAAGALVAYRMIHPDEATAPDDDIAVGRAELSSIDAIARLATIELYNEAAVCDTINNKVIAGIQKQQGSISFDLDEMAIDSSADTIRVTLPRERVELYESTEPGSWQVIDTKGLGLLTSSKLTADEDNLVKRRLRARATRRLYADGTVARARAEACRNLAPLLEALWSRPVVVTVAP